MGNFILRIISKIHPKVSTNQKVHEGKVITVSPIDLREGLTVITPDGIGVVKTIIPDWVTKRPDKVDVLLFKGYIRRYKVLILQQYVVYHKPTEQFIRLTPAHYAYIYRNEQYVEYRVTNRLYAQLTEESKSLYSYVKTLNRVRGGRRALNIINSQNLEIKKKK